MIAIEPHPENYRALLKNISLTGFKNIKPLNIAAFDRDGEVLLSGSVDRLYSVIEHGSMNSLWVNGRTIDSIIFRDLGVAKVDYMKIDVEGAEVEVLKGARKTIAKSPDIKILIEVRDYNETEVNAILKGLGCDKSELLYRGVRNSEKYYSKGR